MATTREQIAAVAQDMLDGRLELHAGCRTIVVMSFDLAKSEQDHGDLRYFVGVDSELDGIPIAT